MFRDSLRWFSRLNFYETLLAKNLYQLIELIGQFDCGLDRENHSANWVLFGERGFGRLRRLNALDVERNASRHFVKGGYTQ